jgi:hypothetical protein
MRHLALGVFLAACGGGAKAAAPAETAAAPDENLKAAPEDTSGGLGCVEPCELTKPAKPAVVEPPPAPAGPPIELEDSPNHCSGKRLVTARDKKKKVATSEQALADYFAVEFPVGLDFTEGAAASKAAATFDAWLTSYTALGKKATEQYEGELTNAKDNAGMVAAAARLAQINYRLASVLAYAEIPVNLRTGDYAAEATEAYCGRMAEVAEPILARADEVRASCTKKAATVPVKKSVWWQQVCVTP